MTKTKQSLGFKRDIRTLPPIELKAVPKEYTYEALDEQGNLQKKKIMLSNCSPESEAHIMTLLRDKHPTWALMQAEAILAPFINQGGQFSPTEQTWSDLKDSLSNFEVKLAFWILCMMKRSLFVKDQAHDPDNSSAVPGMLALPSKFNFSADEEEIDEEFSNADSPYHNLAPSILYMVGVGFRPLIQYIGRQRSIFEYFGEEKLMQYRAMQKDPDGWLIKHVGDPDFDALDPMFRRLLLGTWVYNRASKYVIRDLDTWSTRPTNCVGSPIASIYVRDKNTIVKDDWLL